jgi:hypothetical protein
MQRSSVRVPFREPTLEEILASPITQAVMAADGVDPRDVEAMLRQIANMRRGAMEASSHGIKSGT